MSEQVAGGSAATDTSRPGVRKVYQEPAEPVDLLAVAGAPLARRAAPAIAGVAALVLLALLMRHMRRG